MNLLRLARNGPLVFEGARCRPLRIKEAKELTDDGYDPRERPWYKGALFTATIHWTDVYLFASDGRPAVTCAWAIRDELAKFRVSSVFR